MIGQKEDIWEIISKAMISTYELVRVIASSCIWESLSDSEGEEQLKSWSDGSSSLDSSLATRHSSGTNMIL